MWPAAEIKLSHHSDNVDQAAGSLLRLRDRRSRGIAGWVERLSRIRRRGLRLVRVR